MKPEASLRGASAVAVSPGRRLTLDQNRREHQRESGAHVARDLCVTGDASDAGAQSVELEQDMRVVERSVFGWIASGGSRAAMATIFCGLYDRVRASEDRGALVLVVASRFEAAELDGERVGVDSAPRSPQSWPRPAPCHSRKTGRADCARLREFVDEPLRRGGVEGAPGVDMKAMNVMARIVIGRDVERVGHGLALRGVPLPIPRLRPLRW